MMPYNIIKAIIATSNACDHCYIMHVYTNTSFSVTIAVCMKAVYVKCLLTANNRLHIQVYLFNIFSTGKTHSIYSNLSEFIFLK